MWVCVWVCAGPSTKSETYPWVVWQEGMGCPWGRPVGGEQVGLGDEGVVAFVVDSRVDEPTVHAPSTITCG